MKHPSSKQTQRSLDDGSANKPSSGTVSDDPGTWVDDHADALFRYAMLRARDRSIAEDLVQETFLAAVKSDASFSGDSQRRTWLVGILRHKISDHFRKSGREVQVTADDSSDGAIDSLFDERGRWLKPPKTWDVNPVEIAERAEFWGVLRGCIDALPTRVGKAFSLRMIEETESDEVCKVLKVTPTNLWVLLHRARSRLRECLEKHWFERPEKVAK